MVGLKVVLVWCSAMFVTSLITVLGIVDPLNIMPSHDICAINNRAFFFVGSVCAFFVPMVIMVISYALTVHLLRKKAKFAADVSTGKARTMGRYRSVKRKAQVNKRADPRPYPYDERLGLSRSYANGSSLFSVEDPTQESQGPSTPESIEQDTRNFRMKALRLQLVGSAAWHLRFLATKKRDALAANAVATEQKASKVLGLVFFAFLICWTPFFLLTVFMAACPGCSVHPQLSNMVLWLGYVSSTINPVIYTVFNRTFRSAFINLLCCRYSFISGPNRGFSGSENPCGGGPHGPPPTTCSIHTLSTYVRSPTFPPPTTPAASSNQEHKV
ncbi:hypothetical protein HAZT_HAZT008029 [Hyalella azteca]|nr:hypothetical protein HAZT_HAZT008029 [Hyalella azteca]